MTKTQYVCPENVSAGYVVTYSAQAAEILLDCERCRKEEGHESCPGPNIYNFDIYKDLAADRDRWKARAEAMEKAIFETDVICRMCANRTEICECDSSDWVFDEVRFTEEK
jgi:hypothetical protein